MKREWSSCCYCSRSNGTKLWSGIMLEFVLLVSMDVSASGPLWYQRDANNVWLAHFVFVFIFVFVFWICILNLYLHQANYKINAMRIMFDLQTVYVFLFCIWICIWNLYFHQANYKINAMRIMFDLQTLYMYLYFVFEFIFEICISIRPTTRSTRCG